MPVFLQTDLRGLDAEAAQVGPFPRLRFSSANGERRQTNRRVRSFCRVMTWPPSWFNEQRLHSSLGLVPPIEFETEHYRQIDPQDATARGRTDQSLNRGRFRMVAVQSD